METDFTPGRDDICRHGACRHDPDGDRPHRGDRSGTYDGRSGGDSSGPIVDRAIAGVEHGQILTIHEWAGARSVHRPMRSGQPILILLDPLSRLGFTSPVGGSLGQTALDPTGKNVSKYEERLPAPIGLRNESPPEPPVPADTPSVSVVPLERAIRNARFAMLVATSLSQSIDPPSR